VCVCETIGVPSKLSVLRKSVTLVRMFVFWLTLDLRCEENVTAEVELDTVILHKLNS